MSISNLPISNVGMTRKVPLWAPHLQAVEVDENLPRGFQGSWPRCGTGCACQSQRVRGLNWSRARLSGRVDGGSKSSVFWGKTMGISYDFYGNISGWISWIWRFLRILWILKGGYGDMSKAMILFCCLILFEGCSSTLCIGIVIIHQALKGNHQGFWNHIPIAKKIIFPSK